MASRMLISLFRTFRPYVETGVNIPAEKVFNICAVLESAIDDVEKLEARLAPTLTVPVIEPLPKNVTRLSPKNGARVRSCPPCAPVPPEPEGAA